MMTNSELKIAICDDDDMSRERNALLTKKIMEEANIVYTIYKYENAKALLADIQKGIQFQILLLDVLMDGMDGIELANELRQQKINVDIIFISGDKDNALRGYEVSAARYLIKPVMPDRLKEALLFCHERNIDTREFVVLAASGNCKIHFSDIRYVEAYDRGTRILLKDNEMSTKLKLSELDELLPQNSFVMCHRAYIVNMSEVKAVRRYELELKNGEVIPVSRMRYAEVYEKFVKK